MRYRRRSPDFIGTVALATGSISPGADPVVARTASTDDQKACDGRKQNRVQLREMRRQRCRVILDRLPVLRRSCPYCESCLTMGKTRFCSLLICGREAQPQAEERYVKPPPTRAFIEHWGLSDAQAAASSEGLRFLSEQQVRSPMAAAEPGCFLIWP